jgi:hypothetical protein
MSKKEKHILSNFNREIREKQDATCSVCGPVQAFPYTDKRIERGFSFKCNVSSSKRAIRDRIRRLNDKEYYEKYKARNTASAAKRRANRTSEEKLQHKLNYKKSVYMTIYNRTWEEIEALAKSQDNKCLICEREFLDWNWAVDHDHSCCNDRYSCGNCIRGLLCKSCNGGLGIFRDNIELLENAIKYLKVGKYVDFEQYDVRRVNRKPFSPKHSKTPKTHQIREML